MRKMEEGRWKMNSAGRPYTPAPKAYRRLIVWQRADALTKAIFQLLSKRRLDPWLESQVKRAAMSVTLNIVEDNARASAKEYLHFLDTAFGSLAELDYLMNFLKDSGYMAEGDHARLSSLADEIGNMLVALMRAVGKAAKDGTWKKIGEEPSHYRPSSHLESDPHLPSSIFHLPGEEEGRGA